jgi:tRNA A-37 threonylcarbamoyl transferase component Bud32
LPDWQQITHGETSWHVLPSWESDLLGPEGIRLGQWIQDGQAHVVKDGTHRTVYRVELPHRSFYLKHYRCRRLVQASRHLFRESASRREWRKVRQIHQRHVPTVAPVAVGEVRQHGLVRDSYFVSEAIPDSYPLKDFLREVLPNLPAEDRAGIRRRVVSQAARLCAQTHRSGIWHNDFHPGNLLVRLRDDAPVRSGERASGVQNAESPVPATYDSSQHEELGPNTNRHGLTQPDPSQRDYAEPTSDVRDSHASVETYLIDVPGVRFSAPLGWKRSRDSLAVLYCGLRRLLPPRELWRFWRVYRATREDLDLGDPRQLAREIQASARRHAWRVLASRDRRCLGNGRGFRRIRTAAGVAHATGDFPVETLQQLLEAPDEPIQRRDQTVVKNSPGSVVVRTTLSGDGSQAWDVAYKRCRTRTWFKSLAALFRPSRARVAWLRGHAVLQRGIRTARPLAVVTPRGRPLPRASYLVTEWIGQGLSLHAWAAQLFQQPAAQRRCRADQTAEALGRTLGTMHAEGLAHRDLKGSNLLLIPGVAAVEVCLIDLEGLRIRPAVDFQTRCRDLARLAASVEAHPWVTRSQRLRFLRAYLAASPWDALEWKSLWRGIQPSVAAKLRRFERQGKPVS